MSYPIGRQHDTQRVFRSFGYIRHPDGTYVREDAARRDEVPRKANATSGEEAQPARGPWAAFLSFLCNPLIDVEELDRRL
jgi:hypothetical protein